LRPPKIAASVQGDLKKPGGKFRVSPEILQVSVGLEKDILSYLFRRLFLAYPPVNPHEKVGLMDLDEPGEGLRFPLPAPVDQLDIVGWALVTLGGQKHSFLRASQRVRRGKAVRVTF
jgi:hypothetical protein